MDPLRSTPRLSELSGHLLHLPTADRGTFATLTSVPDIQAWTIAKADEYRQFALALLAIHNLAAPIHRLPTEVLERIFSHCWQRWNSLRLPHVCRLWRSILLGRAAFWANAVAKCVLKEKREIVRNELPLIDALLSRSTQHSHTIEPIFYIFTPSIAQSVTPYVSSVASLQATVARADLQEGLWPTLLSGLPNLESLTIWLTIIEEDLRGAHDFMAYLSYPWTRLPMLSRKALPKLSHLTCPHHMVGRFGDIPLRHLNMQVHVMNPSKLSVECYMPEVVLGRPQGLHLEPYRCRLETLEIGPTCIERNSRTEPLELFSLRNLRIERGQGDDIAARILSWLSLPQTTFVHITNFSAYEDRHCRKLHSIVDAIDRVCLAQIDNGTSSAEWNPSLVHYHVQCSAGGIERLRIDDLGGSSSDAFVTVFGENSPVTHLVLSVVKPTLVVHGINLHAFPHLVHLNVSGSDMKNVGFMLQPTLDPDWVFKQRQLASGSESEHSEESSPPSLSLRLAELVITCRSPENRRLQRLDTDFSTNIDKLFREEYSILQRALVDRASRGTRLTSLELRVHPAAPDRPPDTAADKTATEELGADEQQARGRPKKEAGCSSPDTGSDASSTETASKGPAKPRALWPSDTVRRSALESLKDLVDGPVVLKLLDEAGDEISMDEA